VKDTLERIANDLLVVKDDLETLVIQWPVLNSDPLFYESLETIKKILEEIE
jgi:hypothetical protein